jgi:hypothetical protein
MNNNYFDYIIIGSGFAGLYFAHKFKIKNFIILEKNDRVGGRVYNKMWNNNQISLGGGILRDNDNYTIKLANEFGLDTQEFISSYYFIDLPGLIPNEELYYRPNQIIINYLKKIYQKNIDSIKNLSLTFREFLFKYLDYSIAQTIIDNLLYFSYLDSDVGILLDEKIYQLMRVKSFVARFIKQKGYTGLLDKLVQSIGLSNIKLNTEVKSINKSDNEYIIQCANNKQFICNKLVLATELNPKIKINIEPVNQLYSLIGSCPYIRSYSYWKNGHKITNSIKSQGILGKLILINDNILMTCYTECERATELNNLLKNNNKKEQIDLIHRLMLDSGIGVDRPDDFVYIYWEVGTHYPKPNLDFGYMRKKIKNLAIESNIYLVGEVFAECHGWVNCALESVELLNKDLDK